MVLPKITHLWGLKITYNTIMPKSQHKNISTAVQLFVTKKYVKQTAMKNPCLFFLSKRQVVCMSTFDMCARECECMSNVCIFVFTGVCYEVECMYMSVYVCICGNVCL